MSGRAPLAPFARLILLATPDGGTVVISPLPGESLIGDRAAFPGRAKALFDSLAIDVTHDAAGPDRAAATQFRPAFSYAIPERGCDEPALWRILYLSEGTYALSSFTPAKGRHHLEAAKSVQDSSAVSASTEMPQNPVDLEVPVRRLRLQVWGRVVPRVITVAAGIGGSPRLARCAWPCGHVVVCAPSGRGSRTVNPPHEAGFCR